MNFFSKIVFILLFSALQLNSQFFSSSKLEKAYQALSVYDYFKARKLFYDIHFKKPQAYAGYGLASIFMRADNPFHHLDSASKYANLSFNCYLQKPEPLIVSGFLIDSLSIRKLCDTISYLCFERVKEKNTIQAANHFLLSNYLGAKKYIYEAVYLRDELEYAMVLQANKSDSTLQFIVTHPQSVLLKDATILMERQLYEEITFPKTAAAYISFIEKYPKNIMLNTAYEKLFNIYRQQNNVKGLNEFVLKYPKAPQNIEAWKLLFSLKVKNYTSAELKKFINEHPKFPLKNSILKEVELNKITLYPCEFGDYYGFIDVAAQLVIKANYDEASHFHEGLAVVSRNDSVFYINKENVNPFNQVFSFATVFKNGIAAVKLRNKCYFINRVGQQISKVYEEINELSDKIYVVKSADKYGAIDQYGQLLIEPQFEKLGDFKKDYAYYFENGKYGFVSRSGSVYRAEFEWISDFSEESLAIFRQNGKYGIVHASGKKILPALYDLILEVNSSVYVVTSDNRYGFYSKDGCFIHDVVNDYEREKPVDYYSNGNLFRLHKNGQQALIDFNGRTIINFGTFDDFGFPQNGLIRIKQKTKYGYVDQQLNAKIPQKYSAAGDFEDGLAIVEMKDKKMLIDVNGNTVFSSGSEIKKISKGLYLLEDEAGTLINQKGIVLFQGVENISKIDKDLWLLRLNNSEIKLLND